MPLLRHLRPAVTRTVVAAAIAGALLPAAPAHAAGRDSDARALERGRYLVRIGGCNDCHTPMFGEKAGQVAEQDWLTGVPVGFQGPWGTTYAANLRLTAAAMTEKQWVARLKSPMRPPMPWFNTAAMTDVDLSAMYRYIRHLGAKGDSAPGYAAPGAVVTTPYIVFVPQNLPQAHATAK